VKNSFVGAQLNVTVNGEETRLAGGTNIARLLEILGLKPERLAIEVNRKLVRRSDWVSTGLREGDKVEIVHFVGGGESDA
jgi:thiamine biosynthesis protein ThiS